VESFLGSIKQFGVGRLAAMLGVGAGVVAVLVALVMFMGKEPNELLYSNLDLKEASSVTQALDQAGIKYETKGDGSTIMVARDKVASARLMVAGKGLVSSGSIGYEIFDGNNALGQTDFVQQLNRQRALQGELERTIKAMQGVNSVRVHLVLPKRQLFEEDAEQPSAAVTIGIGAREPGSDMVRAIQNLVSSSVPNMKAEKVNGHRPARQDPVGPVDGSLAGKEAQDRQDRGRGPHRQDRQGHDRRRARPGQGPRQRHRRPRPEPRHHPGREVRSGWPGRPLGKHQRAGQQRDQERRHLGRHRDLERARPGPQRLPAAGLAFERQRERHQLRDFQVTTTTVQEPGTIRKVAVAVAIDGITAPAGKDGKPGAYTPRTAQEIAADRRAGEDRRRLRRPAATR
jgi:flagellar M-ring protein FliF